MFLCFHFFFTRYVPNSLKTQTRNKRNKNQQTKYRITDQTTIEKISMAQFLSHPETKQELTIYLASKTVSYFSVNTTAKKVYVTADTSTQNNQQELPQYHNQEEADTIIILHAAKMSKNINLFVDSPDTDVALLLTYHYKEIPQNTYFVTGTKQQRRTISIKALYDTLGPKKTSALLGMHAITGSDTTGKLAGRTKDFACNVFWNADDEILDCLAMLGEQDFDVDEAFTGLEAFICLLYRSPFRSLEKTRWYFYSNKQAQDCALPPTKSSLAQHILRAHFQTAIWKTSTIPFPVVGDPIDFGWKFDIGQYTPIMTTNQAAPTAILELTKCGCKRGCKSNGCSCRQNKLPCTEMCGCFVHECTNTTDNCNFET
jgi:hypothetical protein